MKRYAAPMIIAAVSLAASFATSLYSQTPQSSTAVCGSGSPASLPANIGIASDESNGISYVRFDVRGGTKTLTLRAVEHVRAVCPIGEHEIIIFGALTGGVSAGYEVVIASTQTGALLTSWESYTPVISPDHQWLIMRKFYPPQTALTVSEEYLLSPLWGIRPDRRVERNQNGEPPAAAVVYPLGQTNAFMSNIGVPPDQVHIFRSRSFFWSEDSRAVVFADSVQGSLNAVLVEINGDRVTTLVHPITAQELCQPPAPTISGSTLDDAYVGPEGGSGGREIQLKFTTSSAACKPKAVVVHTGDFQKPKPEFHPVRKRKPSTPARNE